MLDRTPPLRLPLTLPYACPAHTQPALRPAAFVYQRTFGNSRCHGHRSQYTQSQTLPPSHPSSSRLTLPLLHRVLHVQCGLCSFLVVHSHLGVGVRPAMGPGRPTMRNTHAQTATSSSSTAAGACGSSGST